MIQDYIQDFASEQAIRDDVVTGRISISEGARLLGIVSQVKREQRRRARVDAVTLGPLRRWLRSVLYPGKS